jgi:myo-inositol-1(or 4)-monophosphatase
MSRFTAAERGALLDVATRALDSIEQRFVAGVGAPSLVNKGGTDFATALDFELEQVLSALLTETTGFEVHGEEYGGGDVSTGVMWIVDPIDGTFNYSSGLPVAGTLLALVEDGVPVLGLTWLPLMGLKYAAASGGPVLRNGQPLPPLTDRPLRESIVSFGAFNLDSRGRYPGEFRLAVIGEMSRISSRLRMHGSTGADLAFTAAGVLGGAVSFGHHPWDHAAGVALIRAAGGIVTDLAGEPWQITSPSAVAGAPGVHAQMMDVIATVGDPSGYRPYRRFPTDGAQSSGNSQENAQ